MSEQKDKANFEEREGALGYKVNFEEREGALGQKNKEKLYQLDKSSWYIERTVYLVGGFFVLTSGVLALQVNIKFLYFTIFVGAMFMNFAITGWCPMAIILQKLGFKRK